MSPEIHPGDAEYLGAVAGMASHTISPAATLRLGQLVRVPRAFGDGVQEGTIATREQDRHLGVTWLVDTPQGRLKYLPDEIDVIQQRTAGQRS